jgi:hypothetical protein
VSGKGVGTKVNEPSEKKGELMLKFNLFLSSFIKTLTVILLVVSVFAMFHTPIGMISLAVDTFVLTLNLAD